jgi:hypothetical protein
MGAKTVTVKPHRRSTPSSTPSQRTTSKPGPKTVPVKPHKRTPPDWKLTIKIKKPVHLKNNVLY